MKCPEKDCTTEGPHWHGAKCHHGWFWCDDDCGCGPCPRCLDEDAAEEERDQATEGGTE